MRNQGGAAYLSGVISLQDVVLEFLRRQKVAAGKIARLARACGVTREAMSQTLAGKKGHAPSLDHLVQFCINTKTAPHRLLMALLAVANDMETRPGNTGGLPLLPHVNYVELPGKKGNSYVSVEVADALKKPPRGKKQP